MFKDKNDPLLDVAKAAMQKGDEYRKAVSEVNEHFGVYSRRALPLAKKAEYDIALKKVIAGEKLVLESEEEVLTEARKVTNKIVSAFLNKKKATEKNTHTDGSSMYLHGNKIAWHSDDGSIKGTLAGWPTHTTRERLHALSVAANPNYDHDKHAIYQKNNKQYHGKTEIGDHDVITIKHAEVKEEHENGKDIVKDKDSFKQTLKNGKLIKRKKFSDPIEEAEQLDELSKKTLGNYVFKAADVDKLAKTDKPEKLESRLSNIDKAVKKMKVKTAERLNEKFLANKKDDYSPSYEKSDAKKDRAKRILNKVKDKAKQQLDEVSKKTLSSYIQKAVADQSKKASSRASKNKPADLEDQIRKRGRGINNAKDKIEGPRGKNRSYQTDTSGKMKPTKIFAKEEKKCESHEDEKDDKVLVKKLVKKSALKESLPKNADASDYIHDFVHSTDSRFDGDSKKQRIKRALGAYYSNKEPTVKEDIQNVKEEIANNLYKRYEAVNEAEKQSWVDALNEEEFNILYEFYNPNIKFRQAHANPLADIRNAARNVLAPKPLANGPILKNNTDTAIDLVASGSAAARAVAGVITRNTFGPMAPNRNVGLSSPKAIGARPPATAPATSTPTVAPVTPTEPVAQKVHADVPKTVEPKIIANPTLQQTLDSYSPAERAKRDASDNAAEMDAAQARKLKTTGITPATEPVQTAATAPATETLPKDEPASTPAAAAETRQYKREPMVPRRSFGFGDQGSGSQTAGAITNRALGAVNEEVEQRGSLDAWLNKYVPKKKK